MNLNSTILISNPTFTDNVFSSSVVYVMEHNFSGSLGFIINKNTEKIYENSNSKIMFGGPVDSESLYILDFVDDDLNKLGFTAPIYNVKDKMILAGYTGWDSGQLEDEILSNYWFPVDINLNDISKISIKYRFKYALRKLGIGLHNFSLHSGNS